MNGQSVSFDTSRIKSVSYDSDEHMLFVKFRSGSVYLYYDVPQGVFDGFVVAPLKEGFLRKNVKPRFDWRGYTIRNGQFRTL